MTKRKPSRYVKVDMGYNLAENWVLAKVINERSYLDVFGRDAKDLLVEIPGGERVWAAYWQEITN